MIAGEAQDIADRIVTALAPACSQITIAGSLREDVQTSTTSISC